MLLFCLISPSRITFLIASTHKVQYSGPVGGGGTQWEAAFPSILIFFCPPLLLYPMPDSLNLLFFNAFPTSELSKDCLRTHHQVKMASHRAKTGSPAMAASFRTGLGILKANS